MVSYAMQRLIVPFCVSQAQNQWRSRFWAWSRHGQWHFVKNQDTKLSRTHLILWEWKVRIKCICQSALITTLGYCHRKIEESLKPVKQALRFFSYACGDTMAIMKSPVLGISPPPLPGNMIMTPPYYRRKIEEKWNQNKNP